MARARNIKPGFFENEYLAELPFESRLLFIGLWTLADREGRLEDRPKGIKGKLFPYDDIDINQCLQQLADNSEKFIVRYEHESKRYIQITNFSKHQNPHPKEAGSEIPAPPNHTDRVSIPFYVTQEQRAWVMNRDGHKCCKCGSEENLSIDHIIARSKGGSNNSDNLCVLCVRCNSSKGNRAEEINGKQVIRREIKLQATDEQVTSPADSGFPIPDSGFPIPDSGYRIPENISSSADEGVTNPTDEKSNEPLTKETTEAAQVLIRASNGAYAQPKARNNDNKIDESLVVKKATGTGKKPVNRSITLSATQSTQFERFWLAYPKRKSKGDAEKAWNALQPDEQLVDIMIAAIEKAKASNDWQREGGKFIQHPATWLNKKCWQDEYQNDYLAKEAGENGRKSKYDLPADFYWTDTK